MKRSDALANRQRILDAARTVFAAQGVSADIKLIADHAGLGVGTIYRNFPGKDDLLIELCRQLASEVAGALSEGEDERDPLTGIRVSVVNMFQVASGYGWLMHARFSQQLPPEVQKHLRPPSEDPRFQAVYRMMDRAKHAGQVRDDIDTRVLVVLLFSTIWPLMYHVPPGAERTPTDLANTVLDIVLHGASTLNPAIVQSQAIPSD